MHSMLFLSLFFSSSCSSCSFWFSLHEAKEVREGFLVAGGDVVGDLVEGGLVLVATEEGDRRGCRTREELRLGKQRSHVGLERLFCFLQL